MSIFSSQEHNTIKTTTDGQPEVIIALDWNERLRFYGCIQLKTLVGNLFVLDALFTPEDDFQSVFAPTSGPAISICQALGSTLSKDSQPPNANLEPTAVLL